MQLRFGRRQYYAVAIIGFTIASVWCGISDNIVALVLWRIVQGAFGGGSIATAQATLRDTFPKDKVALSQGIFLLGAVVGPAVGPTLGGWLTDNYAWNWVFFINLVPGTFAAIVILTRLKNPTQPTRLPFDFVGLGLFIAGLGSMQYVLGEGQRDDWFSDATISTFGVSIVSLVAFALWEIFGSRHPVVDLRVLRVPQIAAGGLLTFSFGSILYGSLVLLPQYAEGAQGFTATLSGHLIFVRAVFVASGAPIAVRLAADKRLDLRFILVLGFSLLGVSQLWFANVTTSGSDFGSFVGAGVLAGLGIAMLFIPISVAVLSNLEPQVAPKAAAFRSLWQQLGGSISTALLVTMLAQREALHQDALAQYASPASGPIQRFLGDRVSLNILYSNIIMEASVISYADCQRILGYLAFALTTAEASVNSGAKPRKLS